jgi:hypothetical protein
MFWCLRAKWGAVAISIEFAPCDLHGYADLSAERVLLALNFDMDHRSQR